MKRSISGALLVLACVLPLSAACRTWQVEQDGNGDFAVIQDCVNAASSGDTIRVGVGRYDEWQLYGGNFRQSARIVIDGADLTFIGDAEGGTVVGPEEAHDDEYDHHGLVLMGHATVVVESIKFENLAGGVLNWVGGDVTLERCAFSDCYIGAFLDRGEADVHDCRFSFATHGGVQIFSGAQDRISIRDCTIEKVGGGDLGTGVDVGSCPDTKLERCRITGMRTGAQFSSGTSATMVDCEMSNITRVAVIVGEVCHSLRMMNCLVSDSESGVEVGGAGPSVIVESTVFENMGRATLTGFGLGGGYFRNNILARGYRGVVARPYDPQGKCHSDTVTDYDMRENYWGTDSPDSIQASSAA